MLSVAHEGQAIPIFWHLLDKAGSSHIEEQKKTDQPIYDALWKTRN